MAPKPLQPQLDPAAKIVRRLGGPGKVAEIVGIHRTRVIAWQVPRERGGTGGAIPYRHVDPLIRYARAHKIRLKLREFALRLGQ